MRNNRNEFLGVLQPPQLGMENAVKNVLKSSKKEFRITKLLL